MQLDNAILKSEYCSQCFLMLSESLPQLEMNTTVGDGESVNVSCSMRYRTSSSSQKNVRIVIDHPGADAIHAVIKREANEISAVVTAKVKSSNSTERTQSSFGQNQCTVVFTQWTNDTELAQNIVRFISERKCAADPVLRKCFGKFIINSHTLL